MVSRCGWTIGCPRNVGNTAQPGLRYCKLCFTKMFKNTKAVHKQRILLPEVEFHNKLKTCRPSVGWNQRKWTCCFLCNSIRKRCRSCQLFSKSFSEQVNPCVRYELMIYTCVSDKQCTNVYKTYLISLDSVNMTNCKTFIVFCRVLFLINWTQVVFAKVFWLPWKL